MKKHILALDYVALAMVKGRKGDMKSAAVLFAKAIAAPDAVRGIKTLEVSNKIAFKAEATAKAAVVAAAAAKVAKPKSKVAAAKRIKAAEAEDEFDADGVDDLIGDEPVEEGVEVEAADDEEGEDDVEEGDDEEAADDEEGDEGEAADEGDGDDSFETVLSNFMAGKKPATAKAAPKAAVAKVATKKVTKK